MKIAGLSIVVAYVMAALLTIHNDHYWGDDWAQYVGHARNLAQGRPFADTGYMFNPQSPGVGPAVSQPGLPLLLAPVYAAFGLNLPALKSTEFLLLCGGMALAAVILAETFGVWIGLLAVALYALHPAVLWLRQSIQSEPPYILFAFLAIFLAGRRWRSAATMHVLGYAVLTGLALVIAFSMRQIAGTLLAAIVLCDLLQRRPLATGTVPIVAVSAVGVWTLQQTAAVADYSTELHSSAGYLPAMPSFMSAVWHRAEDYLVVLGTLVPQPLRLSKVAALSVLLLAAAGIVRLCLRPGNGQEAADRQWIPGWLARCPLEIWYLGMYLGALIVLPVFPDQRLLLPILPILLAAAIGGASALVERAARYRRGIVAALVAGACSYLVVLHCHALTGGFRLRPDAGEGKDGALCTDCRDMYAYLAGDTPGDARVAFAKPRALALLADRRAWVWTSRYSQADAWEAMRRVHIDYIVVPSTDHVLASAYPDYLSWAQLASRPGITLVHSNGTFRIYRVNWSRFDQS